MKPRPLARRLLRLVRRLMGTERPIILMYHRVGTPSVDPWRLAVAPERFARQMSLLRRVREVVPLAWLAGEIRQGRLPRRAAAVTFDDGYGDVFRNALPVLRAESIPATVFVTTAAIGDRQGFWWDVLARIVLEPPLLPPELLLQIAGTSYQYVVVDGADPNASTGAVDRQTLHRGLHAILKITDPVSRWEALHELADWAGTDKAARVQDLAMTESEVRELVAAEIEIGAHTITHPSLPVLDAADLTREVKESRRRCRDLAGRPIVGFAYPFGDLNQAAVDAVRAAGFLYGCSTHSREIGPSADILALPRLLAADWDEADFHAEVLTNG